MNAAVEGIEARLAAIRRRIDLACERAGRDPGTVTLIAVSKTFPAEMVEAAWAAGLRDFGENRVQEAAGKAAEVAGHGISPCWHLIGHLQRNKAKDALGTFSLLHSVDSERLLEAINGAAAKPVPICMEVNVAAEPTKFGISCHDVASIADAARRLPNIDLRGLMTVAPRVADPEDVRGVFKTLRKIADSLGLGMLSMGMSEDFEVAIEEGSTHVRIGRALFGERA